MKKPLLFVSFTIIILATGTMLSYFPSFLHIHVLTPRPSFLQNSQNLNIQDIDELLLYTSWGPISALVAPRSELTIGFIPGHIIDVPYASDPKQRIIQ